VRRVEQGFTLVEVLVALAVSALLLGVLMRGSSGALARLRAMDEQRIALIQGRYLLQRGGALDYGGGNGAGVEGALHWTSQEELALTDQRRLNALMRIHVVIRNQQGRVLFDRSALRMKVLP
jgi:prepilin-type N-terminal cleavage/methylation domain-containing protein